MKKNKKKKTMSVREISKEHEIKVMIWLLFIIGIVLWSGYEIKSTESSVYASVKVKMVTNTEEELIEKYKNDKYFKTTYKDYSEDIEVLRGELNIKEEGTEEYNDIQKRLDYYMDNIVEFSLISMDKHNMLLKNCTWILIICLIVTILFVINYFLINYKKDKVYMIITFIEIIFVFLLVIFSGGFIDKIYNMELGLNDSIKFVSLFYPIILGYLYYLIKKDA